MVLKDSKSRICGMVGLADEKIKVNGWVQHVSPFWDLLWMWVSFYNCFGICLLHIKHLGLLKVCSLFCPSSLVARVVNFIVMFTETPAIHLYQEQA
jgi:hypothetical protein